MDTKTVRRMFYLDWLRVFAILAVFVHHSHRFFDTDDWLIKNATTYLPMQILLEFETSWGLPLIFFISGASVFLALEKIRGGKYVLGLFLRLFVPLMVGIFTHVAFMVYLEHLHKGTFSGSFFAFYPHYFEGMYGFGGNFAFHGIHLWYLEMLFLYSLICLPLFLWLKRTSIGRRVLLLALPAILLILNLDEETLGNQAAGGWSMAIYPLFFIGGFVILSNKRLLKYIVRMRWFHLVMGVIFSVAYLFGEFQTYYPTEDFLLADRLVKVLDCFVVWSWLLAVLGFGMRHLNFTNPFLKYANEAVLPFYIFHMSVIIIIGYFVVQWTIPDLMKFVIILTGSFVVIMGLYEFGVRRFNLMRFLFGMKLLARRVDLQTKERQFKEATRTT